MHWKIPIIYTGVAVTALAPYLLYQPPTECSPKIQLCPWSDSANLPDEPAPEHAPALILAPPVASSTVAAPTSALLPYHASRA